jgi:NTP pyrophosphatase (non-canonical NTP hydrolase)
MSALTFADLREVNVARCVEGFRHPLSAWSFTDWIVAVGGEVGEALNIIKKLNRERDRITGNSRTPQELAQDLADELADAAIYVDLLCASENLRFFLPAADFAALRSQSIARMADPVMQERSLSAWGAVALYELGRLAIAKDTFEVADRAGKLLGSIDLIANAAGIDLSEAVVAKFNRTSEKLGFAHRLAA